MPNLRLTRVWIALACIGVLAAALLAVMTAQKNVPPFTQEDRQFPASNSQVMDTRQRPKTRSSMALEPSPNQSFPLPALDTPLAKILGTLRERAAVGDAGSACRLAAEYAYCSNLPRKLSELERWLAQRQLALKLITDPILHREAEDNIRRELQLRERGLSRVRLHCEGVDQVSPADIAHHWLTAAKSGNLAAMKNFASGNAFRWDSILDVLPELSEYRNSAEAMAIEVAKSGDQEMMLALATAYSPLKIGSRSLLAQAVKPDRAKAIALFRFILATSPGDGAAEPNHVGNDASDLIAELEALPGDEDQTRIAGFLADFEKNWRPFGPGYDDNNRSPRDGSVRTIEPGDCTDKPFAPENSGSTL